MSTNHADGLANVGLGLRREMLDEFCRHVPTAIEFFEDDRWQVWTSV
jgi:hypothetical protein